MVRHIACVVIALMFALLSSGCASYLANRRADLQDSVLAYAGAGVSIPFNAGVEVTPLIPIGVGMTGGPDGYALGYGILGRDTYKAKMNIADFPFNIYALKNGDPKQKPFWGGIDLGAPPHKKGWNSRQWGRVGGHVGFLFLHCGLYVEFIEIADFLLGWTTIDICQDDVNLSMEQ